MNKDQVYINRSTLVNRLKECAETIIKNADSIIGKEKFVGGIIVSINLLPGEVPYVNVDKDIYPESRIETATSD